ncbi:MAG: hypothetical protein ABFE16_09895 [Armatimonadia bacterium]
MPTDAPQGVAQPAWIRSFISLRHEMDEWIAASLPVHSRVPYLGIHDEGAFAASFLCHYQLTRDPAILDFARYLRGEFARWAQDHFVHGFAPRGEVHHQTEIFTTFLLRLWHVDPDDQTAELILDAAEHLGNWVPGIPAWYDWDSDRFLGWHLGTCETQDEGFEVADHFRLIQLALGAYLISEDDRYLDLSRRWVTRWAGAIVEAEDEPPNVRFQGTPSVSHPLIETARGSQHAGSGRLGLIEPFVAAGAIDVFLDLYQLTGDALFANAARVLCAPLVEDIADPYSNPPGVLLQRYRLESADTSFDAQVGTALAGVSQEDSGKLVMMLEEPAEGPVRGIGKRSDMIRWAYREDDGLLRPEESPSPSALMLAYQISGSDAYAARALNLAASRLRLARPALTDGRLHGCSGRSVAAVASGHGRDSGYGNVTGSLYPLAYGAVKFVGQERPAVKLLPDGGGLPAEAAALTRRNPVVPPTVALYKDGQLLPVTS